MKYRKETVTTVGTLLCAIAIGFFMQQTEVASHELGKMHGEAPSKAGAVVLDVESIMLTSAEFAAEAVPPKKMTRIEPQDIGQAAAAPQATGASEMVSQQETQVACNITAEAHLVAAAMVHVTLDAPCLPSSSVTVQHIGLLFNQMTDDNGKLDITVPAMSRNATFVMAFTNGEGAVAQTIVEEIAEFNRVALQWKGDTGFGLHAREFGASYGSEGHVWFGAARDMSFAMTGKGGYLTRLGDENIPDGLVAEVYSFPISSPQVSAGVDLSVETEVTNNNCGLEIEAQTLQTYSGKDITSRDLTLSVPGCDASGSFLVLNNLLEDLKVASN